MTHTPCLSTEAQEESLAASPTALTFVLTARCPLDTLHGPQLQDSHTGHMPALHNKAHNLQVELESGPHSEQKEAVGSAECRQLCACYASTHT